MFLQEKQKQEIAFFFFLVAVLCFWTFMKHVHLVYDTECKLKRICKSFLKKLLIIVLENFGSMYDLFYTILHKSFSLSSLTTSSKTMPTAPRWQRSDTTRTTSWKWSPSKASTTTWCTWVSSPRRQAETAASEWFATSAAALMESLFFLFLFLVPGFQFFLPLEVESSSTSPTGCTTC